MSPWAYLVEGDLLPLEQQLAWQMPYPAVLGSVGLEIPSFAAADLAGAAVDIETADLAEVVDLVAVAAVEVALGRVVGVVLVDAIEKPWPKSSFPLVFRTTRKWPAGLEQQQQLEQQLVMEAMELEKCEILRPSQQNSFPSVDLLHWG